MSILLNALAKAHAQKQALRPSSGFESMHPHVSRVERKKIYVSRAGFLGGVIVFCALLGLRFYVTSSSVKVSERVQAPVLSESQEPVQPEWLTWLDKEPQTLMRRIQLAPETLRVDRQAIMERLLAKKLWSLARALAHALPALDPSLEERKMLAVEALESEDYARAYRLYQSLTASADRVPEFWLGLGIAASHAGHETSAVKAYEKAVALMDEDHVAYTFALEQLDALSERM